MSLLDRIAPSRLGRDFRWIWGASSISNLGDGIVLAACVVITWASPAVGVTPTLLARGTYDAFRVKTRPPSFAGSTARGCSVRVSSRSV